MGLARLAGQRVSGILLPPPSQWRGVCCYVRVFCVGAEDPNSGPYACVARTLQLGHLPVPSGIFDKLLLYMCCAISQTSCRVWLWLASWLRSPHLIPTQTQVLSLFEFYQRGKKETERLRIIENAQLVTRLGYSPGRAHSTVPMLVCLP